MKKNKKNSRAPLGHRKGRFEDKATPKSPESPKNVKLQEASQKTQTHRRKGRFEGKASQKSFESVKHTKRRGSRQKAKTPSRKKFTWRDVLIVGIPMVAAVAAVVVVLLVADHGSSYKLTDQGYQYYGGTSAVVQQDAEMKISDEGVVAFSKTGNETTLPIYLENSPSVVLTTDMLYYMPRSGNYTRVAAFSQIERLPNGMITVTREKKSEKPEAGFLYDGKDFYLFLEPVVITYMGYRAELPALSYAEVRYGGDLMLFNYETKEFIIEALDGAVLAETPYKDYSISLVGDTVTDKDGEQSLLITKPGLIDPLV